MSQCLAKNRPAVNTCSTHERRAGVDGRGGRGLRQCPRTWRSLRCCTTVATLCDDGSPVTSLQKGKWRLGPVPWATEESYVGPGDLIPAPAPRFPQFQGSVNVYCKVRPGFPHRAQQCRLWPPVSQPRVGTVQLGSIRGL